MGSVDHSFQDSAYVCVDNVILPHFSTVCWVGASGLYIGGSDLTGDKHMTTVISSSLLQQSARQFSLLLVVLAYHSYLEAGY